MNKLYKLPIGVNAKGENVKIYDQNNTIGI